MRHWFSLDVESMGLLGEPFAVGWVIVDEEGNEKEEGYLAYPHLTEGVSPDDMKWMQENVLPHLPEPNCKDADDLCHRFWDAWTTAHVNYDGLTMVSDVPFPVEAGFLLRCLKMLGLGMGDSPLPIIDVASVLLATGQDPLGTYSRLDNELPAHNPLNDARQSVRQMLQALEGLDDLALPV